MQSVKSKTTGYFMTFHFLRALQKPGEVKYRDFTSFCPCITTTCLTLTEKGDFPAFLRTSGAKAADRAGSPRFFG